MKFWELPYTPDNTCRNDAFRNNQVYQYGVHPFGLLPSWGCIYFPAVDDTDKFLYKHFWPTNIV